MYEGYYENIARFHLKYFISPIIRCAKINETFSNSSERPLRIIHGPGIDFPKNRWYYTDTIVVFIHASLVNELTKRYSNLLYC